MNKTHEVKELTPPVQSVPSYLIFSKKKNLGTVRDEFDATLRELKREGVAQKIVDSYFEYRRNYGEQQRPFVITHVFFEPFVWSESENSKGIYVDVLTEALEYRAGIKVRFRDLPWERAQIEVKNGEADGLVALATPERQEYSILVDEPIVKANIGLFTYRNHPEFKQFVSIKTPKELSRFRLLSYSGDGWAKKYLGQYSIDLSAPDLVSALKMLSSKRADLLVQTDEVILHNINKMNLSDHIEKVPGVSFQSLDFQLMISKESPYIGLVPQLNQVLEEMRQDGTLSEIYNSYR